MELYAEVVKNMGTKLGFIAQRAAREPKTRFNNLMHHINKDSLKAYFYKLGRNRAEGVDGISWQEYSKNIDSNIKGLLGRMKNMAYRPQPVKRVYIPKAKNESRPLGLPATEDKIVQKTLAGIMEAIYEQDFHDCSYGFRPKRRCHQALKQVSKLINDRPINHVIEADIKGFFDNISHQKLLDLLKMRIADEKFLRYIVRFIKSGYIEGETLKKAKRGTPQGGNISPMLANIFLHYVLDDWFEKEIKPCLRGQSYLVRYCDDFVILVQYKAEAEQTLQRLRERLKAHELELSEEKTRVLSFGYFERENAKKQQRKPNTFDFLGFTHYCSQTRRKAFKVGRKTSAQRFSRSCRAMGIWLKTERNRLKLKELWKELAIKLKGHYQYYGISDNLRSITQFHRATLRLAYIWFNRRSQKKSFSWQEFTEYLKCYPLPKPRIVYSFYA